MDRFEPVCHLSIDTSEPEVDMQTILHVSGFVYILV